MDRLNWIAGLLRHIGLNAEADVLLYIQYKASALLEEIENGIPKDCKRDKS